VRALGAFVAMACLLAVAGCGGGGKNDCGDMANKIWNCVDSLGAGDEVNKAEIKAGCEEAVCAEKQQAIDCIMALSCSESIMADTEACIAEHGCNEPVVRQ
jgi:hypothetical protein